MAEQSAKEILESMIAGTHENEVVSEEGVDEEVDTTEEEEVQETSETEEETTETDTNEDEEVDIEDTDLNEETETKDDPEGEGDDADPETSEVADESQEEDTQEDESSKDESDDTKEESDSERYMYNGVDTKEFFEKVALAKFTANGKEVEGFKDPEDLIRAQQMLHGYSDKMKVFKEYKPFIKAMQERELTKDSDKFNLAMSLLDGDTEAIKQVLKDKNIDPMELDLEDVKYAPKNTLPSEAQLVIEEAYEQADNLGIGDKFGKVVSKDWDVASLQELVNNGAVRNDLMQHLKDGTYDDVQTEIQKMELLDSTGKLSNMSSVDKYRLAIGRLNQYTQAETKVEEEVKQVPSIEEKKAEEFKKKAAAKKEAEADEARKKAAAVSKKKRAVKKSKPKPMEELKGDEFKDAFQQMLMS